MAINIATKAILKILSFGGIDVEVSRQLADLKRLDPMKIFYKKMDLQVYNGDYEVPIRVFFPDEESYLEKDQIKGRKIMLFLHGGGWATEHVENYERVCSRMAQATGQTVAAVEYRLAPEHKFPTGLMDCYAVARALYTHPDTMPGGYYSDWRQCRWQSGGSIVHYGTGPWRIYAKETDSDLSGSQ